jgi:hypothetical protein
MNYYPDFDSYFIRERHKELLRETEHRRLGENRELGSANHPGRSPCGVMPLTPIAL